MLMTTPAAQHLAPTGVLRACINIGNAVLARRDGPDEAPQGVSVDIAAELARRLGVPIEYLVVTSAGQSVEAVTDGRADIGFFAIDPSRAATIAFTDAYLHIEGWYVVRDASPMTQNADVDRPGVRVAVGARSAYDLFLSREITDAELVRAPNPQAVTPLFLAEGLDVAAGVRQQLEQDMLAHPGLRFLPERFMVIRQAMGLDRRRGDAAASALTSFVADLTATDFVARALSEHGIDGATPVPTQA